MENDRFELEEWFEVQRECAQCGEHFLPDYRYTKLCWNCRYPLKVIDTDDLKHLYKGITKLLGNTY